jgi:transposase
MILCANRFGAGEHHGRGLFAGSSRSGDGGGGRGAGVYAAAPLFRVSVSYIYKALGRRRATGDVTAHKSGGGPKPKPAAYDEALRAQVAQKADVTLIELQAWLADDHAMKVSVGCLWARVRYLGLTLKKIAARRGAGPGRRS